VTGRAIASATLFVLGTIPPTVLAVLWYARAADYLWAIRGPGPFAHLGGGPAMLAALIFTAAWTAGSWGAGIWLIARETRAGHSPS
jgi:hypothetical protein